MSIDLLEKICIGAMVISSAGVVISSMIALDNSFEIIDEYKKELARTSKNNKESE